MIVHCHGSEVRLSSKSAGSPEVSSIRIVGIAISISFFISDFRTPGLPDFRTPI